MRIYARFFGLCCIIGALSTAVEAKVTFLPDWMASDMDFGYSDFGCCGWTYGDDVCDVRRFRLLALLLPFCFYFLPYLFPLKK